MLESFVVNFFQIFVVSRSVENVIESNFWLGLYVYKASKRVLPIFQGSLSLRRRTIKHKQEMR